VRDYSIESARAGVARAYVYENHPAQRYPQIAAAEQEAKQAGLIALTETAHFCSSKVLTAWLRH
jgi:hypothetical protein